MEDLTECPTCKRDDFASPKGIRQHHKIAHNEHLPNRTCARCGTDFYDSKSVRKHCKDCKGHIIPKPDDVEIAEDKEWEELTPYQRHYYRNREDEIERAIQQKKDVRKWFKEIKSGLECAECGEDRNPCLDFHHQNDDKEFMIGEAVGRNGYSKDKILREIKKCKVLCANCHRVLHFDG